MTTEQYLTSGTTEPPPLLFTFKMEDNSTLDGRPNLWSKITTNNSTHTTITSNWEDLGLGIVANIKYVLYEIYRVNPTDDKLLLTFINLCPEPSSRILLLTYLVNFNMISLETYNQAVIKMEGINVLHDWDLLIFGIIPNTSPILRGAPWIPTPDNKVETMSNIIDTFEDGTLVFGRLSVFEGADWARSMSMYGIEYAIVKSTKLKHNHLFKGLYVHRFNIVKNVCKFHGLDLYLNIDSLLDKHMTIEIFDIYLHNALQYGKNFEFDYWFTHNADSKLFGQMLVSITKMSNDETHPIPILDPFWIETLMIGMSKREEFESIFDQPIVNNWLTSKGCQIYKHMTIDQRVDTFTDSSNDGTFKREYTLYDI